MNNKTIDQIALKFVQSDKCQCFSLPTTFTIYTYINSFLASGDLISADHFLEQFRLRTGPRESLDPNCLIVILKEFFEKVIFEKISR